MKTPSYPGTDIPVRRGDLVRWYGDEAPSTVLFVISTNDFPDDEDEASRDWFRREFGAGIMLNTPSAGLVLESEDCENMTLIRAVDEQA